MGLFVGQKADVHVPFFLEGHGDDAGSVQFLVDDPAAHGIAVEPDQQVEQGGPVSDPDVFAADQGAEDLFGKIEGVVVSLDVRQVGIGSQFFHGNAVPSRQGVGRVEEHMGPGHEQFPEHQVVGLEDFLEDGFVESIVVQDADFTAHVGHIVDDGVGLGLLEAEIVGIAPVLFDQIHKGVHRKGIVLGGHGEFLLAPGLFLVPGFQEICLFQHLPGIAQEDFPVPGQVDPLVGPFKDLDAHFPFQFPDHLGEAGLGDEQGLGRSAEGSGFGNGHNIAQLL